MRGEKDRQAWERQLHEPARAYHAFRHVLDLGDAKRSLYAAWVRHKAQCEHVQVPEGRRRARGRWEVWSATWDWQSRAEAYDADLQRQKDVAFASAQREACARHARESQAAQTVLTVYVRAVLNRLGHPEFLAGVSAMGDIALLREAARAVAGLPQLAMMERLALNTSCVAIEDRRESTFAARVVADPVAAELAIRLLDRIAGTGPDTPPAPRDLVVDRAVH